MSDEFILLSKKQIGMLADHFYNELSPIPYHDKKARNKLFSECIKKVETIIISNMIDYVDNNPDTDANLLTPRIIDPEYPAVVYPAISLPSYPA